MALLFSAGVAAAGSYLKLHVTVEDYVNAGLHVVWLRFASLPDSSLDLNLKREEVELVLVVSKFAFSMKTTIQDL